MLTRKDRTAMTRVSSRRGQGLDPAYAAGSWGSVIVPLAMRDSVTVPSSLRSLRALRDESAGWRGMGTTQGVGGVEPDRDGGGRRGGAAEPAEGVDRAEQGVELVGVEEGEVAGGHQLAEQGDVDEQEHPAVQPQARQRHPAAGGAEPEEERQRELGE